jgi:hypothetical protein
MKEILGTTDINLITYTKFGKNMIAALSTIRLAIYNETTKDTEIVRFAILGLVIEEGKFEEEIKDKKYLVTEIIKWVIVFSAIFLVILMFA